MDSNFRYRGRRPASGRSLRAQRVETDAAKREFGSDSCLFSPRFVVIIVVSIRQLITLQITDLHPMRVQEIIAER
jgi:hypothetical protein